MKVCPHCDSRDVPDNSKKCPYCFYVFEHMEDKKDVPVDGPPTSFLGNENDDQSSEWAESAYLERVKHEKEKKKRIVGAVLAVVVLFVLLKSMLGSGGEKNAIVDGLGTKEVRNGMTSTEAAGIETNPETSRAVEVTTAPEAVIADVQAARNVNINNLQKVRILRETTTESSYIVQKDAAIDNTAWSAFDGDSVTSWQEGVDGDGIGQFIYAGFDRNYEVEAITLQLGNHRSDSWYVKNNVPKVLTINLSGNIFQLSFPKNKEEFAVVLSRPVLASDIRITIDEVYSGTAYSDTIIAEVGVYGK